MKRFMMLFQAVMVLGLVFFISQAVSAGPSASPKAPVTKAVQPLPPPAPLPRPLPDCEPPKVRIPPATQDSKPVIAINALASGGSGQIQYPEASPAVCASPCQNKVSLNTELVITIHAKNPGGVKNIGVTVTPPNGPSYGIERTAAPDANNCVYPSLSILGHNGAGGIGGTPILFRMNKPTSKATLLVRVTNFNGQSALYAITYYVKGATQPGTPAPAAKGCLTIHYGFTWGSYPSEMASKELPVTVHFHGEYKGSTKPKNKALTSFDLTKTYKVLYPNSSTWSGVRETFNNLIPGSWLVTAQYVSGMGGLKHYQTAMACTGTVPAGIVCRPFYFNHDQQTCSSQ